MATRKIEETDGMNEQALTEKAADFVAMNAETPIVSWSWLTEGGGLPTRGPETWAKAHVQFDDGRTRTVRLADVQSMKDAGYRPVWKKV